MPGIFGSKPSNSHIIWRSGREQDGQKRFDFEYLALWAAHFGVDYETWSRTDHERSEDPRDQHALIFKYARTGGQRVSLGDREWEMGTQRKPRTFIEIDEAGVARCKAWTAEVILDIAELVVDGTTFKIRTMDGAKKHLDVRDLATRPDRQEG